MARRIVISGGPGTGKTALIRELEGQGYFCFHEIVREMTVEAKKQEDPDRHLVNPLAFVSDPLAFNKKILKGRIQQYHAATEFQAPLVFYDRGIPDVIAYMDYFRQEYNHEFLQPCMDLRYDTAILLPPWKAIYTRDDERLESFEQACQIHECLALSYERCGYEVRTLETGTVRERVAGLLQLIGETL